MLNFSIFLLLVLANFSMAYVPEGSYGHYDNSRYQPKGEYYDIDGLDIYLARPGITGDFSKGVLWSHDIYGWVEGRTMELVDKLAETSEYTVILPNFYRDVVWPDAIYYNWTRQGQSDWEDRISPFLSALGIDKIGIVGNCVGSYFTLHASAYPNVKCGFSTHPSHVAVTSYYPDESPDDLYRGVVANNAPQYFGPSLEEGPHYRPGGGAEEALGDLLTIVEYPCHHGYFSRGDLDDPQVVECDEQAWADMISFFEACII